MRVLLDTHVLVWWFNNESRISRRARSIITDQGNAVLVSAVTAWELAIKVQLNKMEAYPLVAELARCLEEEGFLEHRSTLGRPYVLGTCPYITAIRSIGSS